MFARVVDGLAFRYHWATEGLRPEDHAFRPGPESMSTFELLEHILHLVLMIEQTVRNAPERESVSYEGADELRRRTLDRLALVRDLLASTNDATLSTHQVLRRPGRRYPVWNILNGPLADALTHVGQLNAWRRLNGNPAPRADVFGGRAPRPSEG